MAKTKKKEKTNKKIINFNDIKNKGTLDYILVTITIILTLIGLVMVLSASAPSALINYNNSYYFFNKEVLGAVVGIIMMFIISIFDITKLKKSYKLFYLLAIASALIVIVPGLGTGAKGATRWLKFGPITFQPSELTKLFLIIAYSGYYSDTNIDFTKFNTLTNEGDHLEAKEILGRIETEMQDFEQIVEEVPKYLKEIEEEYEDQVADLKEGYQKMVEEHYQFPKISIPAEIQKIEEIITVAREHIRATELEEARQQLDKVAREIDQLYAVMENEIEAKAFVQRNRAQVERKLNQVLQSNRYVNIEVDRVAQNFVLANNEFNRVQEFAKQLEKEQEAVAYYSKALQNQQVPYSIVKEHYEIVLNTLKEIDENQLALVNTLNDLSQQEKSIRDGLDVFELDLRNMKRTIEKYHLPGLPKEYLELFFATSSRIEQLSQLMNRVKLDMTEITGLNQTIEDDVEKLDIMTEEIVDNAQLTEYMIQQANRYRLEHPEIDTAIQQSLEQFNHFYRYEESLAIIEKALNQVEPGSAQRVRDNYQAEKNNSLFF